MTFNFRNKTVLVTGSTRGIGYATAVLFLKSGAKVVVNSRHFKDIVRTVKKLRALGYKNVFGVKADVSNQKEVKRMIRRIADRWGAVDILVNNAGIREGGRIEYLSDASWQKVLDVNLWGAFLCCQQVIPAMKKKRAGKIVVVASEAGKVGSPYSSIAYSASKGGEIALVKCLAKELAPFKINVNAVCPGIIKTDFIPRNKNISDAELKSKILWREMGRPEDVAHLILYLASDEARYITGQAFSINGGMYTNYP